MGFHRKAVCISRRGGFTLVEVLIGMFFVAMTVALIAGLSQQVMQLSKKGTQTGTILELRSMTNSITKNSDSWLNLMRSSTHTKGLYAGCIPDPKVNISTYSCPSVDDGLLTSEKDLGEIANGQFHVVSAPLVNNTGEALAGTIDAPVYLTIEGRLCSEGDLSKCAFKSTGFFMRSNDKTNEDPGSIKFVIKVERNPLNLASGTTPMKPQYMSVDIGESWKDPTVVFGGVCPKGTLKVGYLSNGKPSCVNTSKSCSTNQLPIGVDSNGDTICKTLPDCTGSGGGVVLNPSGDDLMCSSASPCGANKLFLGYFAGSGDPMCSSSEMKCPAGHVQTGITISGGDMKAECEELPNCKEANKRLAFNGTNFVCEAATSPISCGVNEVMTGINNLGEPICVARAPASDDQSCAVGQEMYGIDSVGKIKCRPASGGGGGGGRSNCPTGYSLIGTPGDASAYCISTARRAPALIDEAITDCEDDTPKARLCTPDEWYTACRNQDAAIPAITERLFVGGSGSGNAKVEFLSIAPGSKSAYGGSHYLADVSCSAGASDCSQPPDACYSHSEHLVRHYKVKVGYRCCLK